MYAGQLMKLDRRKYIMKKIILGLAAGAILILTACGNSNNSDTSTVEKGKTKGNNIEAEVSTSEEIVEHGFWNDDKTEFTTAYGEKLSKEEYDILLNMLNYEEEVEYLGKDSVDLYLLRTDFYRNDIMMVFEQDMEWSYDIEYTDFDFLCAKGNSTPYKVIAKATLNDQLYEKMKKGFSESEKKQKSSLDEFNSIVDEADVAKVGATPDFEVFGGKRTMILLNKYEAEGIDVGLFNDKTKEMIVYYYNPNLEKEFLQSFDPSK